MKTVYFVFLDNNAYERQSDGVEFCLIPEFNDNKIYFYCEKYSLFWDPIETAGDPAKSCNFKLRQKIIPATLDNLVNNNLIQYINSVKEYDTTTKKITYLHLK